MSKKKEIEKILNDKEYEQLLHQIMERSKTGIEKAADEVRKAQLATYWDNGRYIVEYEQSMSGFENVRKNPEMASLQ